MKHQPKSLFESGEFVLNSGTITDWRINAEFLVSSDIKVCARLLASILPPYDAVEGVPSGGLQLADELREFIIPGAKRLVIADDVWTTGGSWNRIRGDREAFGAIIFNRGGMLPDNIKVLWQLAPKLTKAQI